MIKGFNQNKRIAIWAMILIVAVSNYLVQFPINDWLTLGALTYPISFVVTELINRLYGPKVARQVVYIGFVLAVILSIWTATLKIACASGVAFLVAQLLDIYIFTELRNHRWWIAPLFASFSASVIDSAIFWSLAFWGEPVPFLTWALGDLIVKLILDCLFLTPFRFISLKMLRFKYT